MSAQWTGMLMILLAVLVESFAQLALKVGSAGGPAILAGPLRTWAMRTAVVSSARAWFFAGVGAYCLEIVFYTLALNCLEVTVAFPMGSLCFVGVALLSKFLLGEKVGTIRWFGIGCILAGTLLLAV